MTFLTEEKVHKILKNNPNYKEWYQLFVKFLPLYGVDTIQKTASFLAQTCHESSYYTHLKENLNYSTPERLLEIYPKYINASNVSEYLKNPNALANKVYANRMGNGDETSGDGSKFLGRGAIQLTGRDAYIKLSKFLMKTLDATTQYLETKEGALVSALYFWQSHGLNNLTNQTQVTKIVNGGLNGLADRTNNYVNFLKILK